MGQTVLVVDDNALNRELLRLVLEQEGYVVREAKSAEDALTLTAQIHPDLVLMDCHLPGMDGLTATRHMKADKGIRDIPVVAVTAYAMPGDREKAIEAGCQDYISKPVDFAKLIQLVSQLIGVQAQ